MKKVELILFLFIIFNFVIFFPFFAKSNGIENLIVGSDETQNNLLRLKMYLYKINDQDPNFDYYLVNLNMLEKAYNNDIFVEIWFIRTYIFFNASYGEIVALESFREPDPILYSLEGVYFKLFFEYNLEFSVPTEYVKYWYHNGMNNMPVWDVDALLGGWGIIPATRDNVNFIIGFRVSQGAHVSIRGNCYVLWCLWITPSLKIPIIDGWGENCYIYY
ncbi:MAG: hypothetical protein ACP6IY_18635 [Promethearchaeia archaeon]